MAISISQLIAWTMEVKARASGPAPLETAEAMAEEGKIIVQTLLSRGGRSAPGMPPGLQTGHLRASITVSPAIMVAAGVGEASVGPHTVYARLLEFGGTNFPDGKFLHWHDDRGETWAKSVTIEERPYMRRMRDEGIATGAFREAAKDAFAAATGL